MRRASILKFLRAALAFSAVLWLLQGCTREEGPWHHKLATLPPELRRYLFDRFDRDKDLRKERPEIPERKAEELITDNRAKFEPTCTLYPGFSHTLFVRAKPVGRDWVMQYESGGFVHSTSVLVVSQRTDGSFSERENFFVFTSNPTEAEIFKLLSRNGASKLAAEENRRF